MLSTLTSSTTTNWYDVQNHQCPIFVEMTQAATNAGTEGRFTPAELRERQRSDLDRLSTLVQFVFRRVICSLAGEPEATL